LTRAKFFDEISVSGGKMKKIVALLLVFSFISLNTGLIAKEKHGADLIVVKKDGQELQGELIAVKKDSLLLMGYVTAVDVTINIDDIKVIKIRKKSGFEKGFLGGGLAGAAVGIIIYAAAGEDQNFIGYVLIAGIFGATGGLLGGLIGAAAGSGGKTYQIEGRDSATIEVYLEELRKRARVPDFQ
jgi:hypothetical protein